MCNCNHRRRSVLEVPDVEFSIPLVCLLIIVIIALLSSCTTVVEIQAPPDAGSLVMPDAGAVTVDAPAVTSPLCTTTATRTDASVHISTTYTCSPSQLGSLVLTMSDASGTVGSLSRLVTCPATVEVDFPTRPGPRAPVQLASRFELDGGGTLDGGVGVSCSIQQAP